MEEKQDYHKKPQWYVDEINDIRSHIASKASIGFPKAKYGKPKGGYEEFIRSIEGRTKPQ